MDIDYRDDLWREFILNIGGRPVPVRHPTTNLYTMRVKGGLKVDRIEAEELDMPGCVLCGATFDYWGTQIRAFGKYKNKQGENKARAVWNVTRGGYRVYHSIRHTNYIPIVQVAGWDSNNVNWSLAPRVYEIEPYSFVVRLLTNGDNPRMEGFSYVAYKTE